MRLYFFLGVLLCSCSDDEKFDIKVSDTQTNNFINLSDATGIASVIEFSVNDSGSKTNRRVSTNKNIESVLEVPDENGHVVYYIVNYEQSGFVIISADNRTNPILGFSESSQFSLNTNMYPKGLVEWLASTKDYIREIREHNIEQSKLMEEAWKLCEIQLTIGQSNFDCDNQMDCENQSTKVGP